jgi:hypothetical protein
MPFEVNRTILEPHRRRSLDVSGDLSTQRARASALPPLSRPLQKLICAQYAATVLFALAACHFYSIVSAVDLMTVQAQNIRDLGQELPSASPISGHLESSRGDKMRCQRLIAFLNTVVSAYK